MNGQTLFKSRWMPAAVFCFLLCVSILGCDSEDRRQLIKKHQLENELKVGQVLRLSSLVKTSDGVVCVLYPYQERVAREDPQSTRINAWLKASGYTGDEGRWAFVVAEPERVHLSRFRRSDELHAFRYPVQPEEKAQLPPGFVPAGCASLAHATLTKIESHNGIFLIMGEIK